ncbi:MAG: thiamine pyrophosphate-dependent dehydrogenase E1 component subunit alpha [Ignavibacteria bacterium]|nr:thiamine pyrophosphate-dependent dehydrogenase E1 component subunit alpha [Ignavibacteria bacterium]
MPKPISKSISKKKPTQTVSSKISAEQKLKLYSFMVLMREFENAVFKLYRQGKVVGGAYSSEGNEATAIGSAFALEKHDYLFPMHRDIGAHFVKGQTPRNIMLQYLARASSPARGRDGTGHYADAKLKIYGNISPLGAMIPLANGVALASKMRKENAVVLNYIGDGGASIGDFHEALVMASVMKLPLVLIIENNQFAYSTPIAKQFIVEKLSSRAIGYGIPGVTIDGTDVELVYETTKQAIERARNGEGPTLIESVTMRMQGHAIHDDMFYVPKQLLTQWKKKDPIANYEKKLVAEKILSDKKKKEIFTEIKLQIDDAVEFAVNEPYPNGEEAALGVFAD